MHHTRPAIPHGRAGERSGVGARLRAWWIGGLLCQAAKEAIVKDKHPLGTLDLVFYLFDGGLNIQYYNHHEVGGAFDAFYLFNAGMSTQQ